MKPGCLIVLIIIGCIEYLPVSAQDSVRTVFKVTTRTPLPMDENTIIYNKVTGERMNHVDMVKIIRSNPKVSITRQIGERGEVISLLYDPNNSTGKPNRDISYRAKTGELFPEFIVTTTTDHLIQSRELNGKVVIMIFILSLREPFVTPKMITEWDEFIQARAPQNCVPIIFTISDTKEVEQFQSHAKLSYPIVGDAINFHERYIVTDYPSYVVRDKVGQMSGYANSLNELEVLLKSIQ